MSLKNMTLEELEEVEEQLHEKEQEEELTYSLYPQKIRIYEEMLRKMVQEQDMTYYDYVEKRLVLHLVHYGTYLKMQYEKSDEAALQCLKRALKYDKYNPIASYRIGFLLYRRGEYKEAMVRFERAIANQKSYQNREYQLSERQLANAHLYLANSALHLAKQTYEQMEQLSFDQHQALPNYELSPIYESLADNDRYLKENAFYQITPEGTATCSKEACEELITHEPADTLVLYFGDRQITLTFNETSLALTQEQGDILRYVLVKSREGLPASRMTLQTIFSHSIAEGITKENFRKKFSRLRGKLEEYGIPDIIETASHMGETAYRFNGSLPYVVMYRVDEESGYIL